MGCLFVVHTPAVIETRRRGFMKAARVQWPSLTLDVIDVCGT